jgi:hypothetical protein
MHALNDIDKIRKVALYVGIVSLTVACLMTFKFGYAMSQLHAVSLALLTVAGSIIFPYARHLRSTGSTKALTYVALGAMFLAVEFFSHLGYTVGTRVMETENTGVQNAVYQHNQDALASETANIDMWRTQLAELQKQNAWTASVTADGLRAQLASAQKAVDLEAARGGCKSKCLALMDKKADLEARIATTEKVEDLTKRIEATQRLIDKKLAEANTTEFKTSSVVAQTSFVAQLVTQDLDPDRKSMTWTQIAIGFAIALVTTFLAPTMFSMALGPVSERKGGWTYPARRDDERPSETPVAGSHTISERVVEKPIYVTDLGFAKALAERRALQAA